MLLQSTGVEFPEVTTFWDGDKMRSVGAGVRAKKFAFVPVKVSLLGTAQRAWPQLWRAWLAWHGRKGPVASKLIAKNSEFRPSK